MSESEESPAQRQARLRRERREAKIMAGGTSRLDKITQLSGRTPESTRREPSPSNPAVPASQPQPRAAPLPRQAPLSNTADQSPEQIQAQEEYLRAMLRAQEPQGDPDQGAGPEDPMARLMRQFMGNAEGGGDPSNPGGFPFSPEDIQSATGLPPFLTNMLLGQQKPPQTAAQKKEELVWKTVHILFAVLAGAYVLYMVTGSIATYGPRPPPPATAQNPLLLFVLGEVLLESATMTLRDKAAGPAGRSWLQMLKALGRDGGIVVFVLGLGLWWSGIDSA